MWTQITCLANDEQSIPRWQRVAVPLPPQCYEKRDSQVSKYLGRTDVLFESGYKAGSSREVVSLGCSCPAPGTRSIHR